MLEQATRQGLDWAFIVDHWAQGARTALGAAAVRELAPLPNRDAVIEALDATDEMLWIESQGIDLPVGAVEDVRSPIERAAKGQVLEGAELLSSARTLDALRQVRKVLDRTLDNTPTLSTWAEAIEIDGVVVDDVLSAFEASGRLSAARYPELGELRQAIQTLHAEVRSTLDRLVKSEDLGDDLLQDRYWTVRDDRYVLPIKSHAKRWDLGLVHGTSGTGRTVFVEPHAVIQLNNQLRLAEGRLLAAEHAIHAELSGELGTQAEAADVALEVAVRLDITAARTQLAHRLEATRPQVGEGERIAVRQARHPVLVLRGVDVVANDLEVATAHPVLVLSGPNAGGKTVAMKTMGLCALLVRHGCHVPTAEDSRVDYFDAVYASIGDQQTVEGDLSSFSAQLLTLRHMLDVAGPRQLLLLDEIASGTDPAQGAAIAQAICEHLAEAGPRVVVTTHFAALKALGAADPRFSVAAVQYRDGRATYRVLQGATGESHAMEIAARMGLPAEVLERAEAALGEQEAELGRLLVALEAERARAEEAREEVQRLVAEADARAASLAAREARVKSRAKELEAEGAAQYLKRLADAERAVGQVVAELQRAPSHRYAQAARSTIDALRSIVPADAAPERAPAPRPIQVGDRVRIAGGSSKGEVVSLSGKTAQIQVGGLKVKAKVADLELAGAPRRAAPEPSFAEPKRAASEGPTLDEAVRVPGNTLDMRGMRVDEGQDAAEQFFDKSMRSGWDSVFLLHGHGTGKLKVGLRRWLRSCGYVRDWSPANEDQGGDAFTVVQLA
ncbi:MAG: Smr/MutS family protein [Myxococcota bacterium]